MTSPDSLVLILRPIHSRHFRLHAYRHALLAQASTSRDDDSDEDDDRDEGEREDDAEDDRPHCARVQVVLHRGVVHLSRRLAEVAQLNLI